MQQSVRFSGSNTFFFKKKREKRDLKTKMFGKNFLSGW
jgi:hypothetical protein